MCQEVKMYLPHHLPPPRSFWRIWPSLVGWLPIKGEIGTKKRRVVTFCHLSQNYLIVSAIKPTLCSNCAFSLSKDLHRLIICVPTGSGGYVTVKHRSIQNFDPISSSIYYIVCSVFKASLYMIFETMVFWKGLALNKGNNKWNVTLISSHVLIVIRVIDMQHISQKAWH